ncbi:MAG TPA: hypothetical protein VFT21_01815 [Gemmatimonadaceae bacterium]|nr:hypothetical protein [Gemmatimonadaceae bacterium]
MPAILHLTNGDSAASGMSAGGIPGEIIPWRDVLHEGPVPSGLSLMELSRTRAKYLATEGLGDLEAIQKNFDDRDDMLRRYADFDEVVLWFEWDLYDQLQLIQILDFFSVTTADERAETETHLSIVSFEGYLGALDPEQFEPFFESRKPLDQSMIDIGHQGWSAFRSPDPRDLERVALGDTRPLEFLAPTLWRQLEELPSASNGLSRSEQQVLESVAHGPLSFHEIFRNVANREERIFCGDAIMARYIERMSLTEIPLIAYASGDPIDAPRTEEDSRAFRNAEMGLTEAGREVLACERDWIEMGGSDRWLGGVHLDGSSAAWRWNPDTRRVIEVNAGASV